MALVALVFSNPSRTVRIYAVREYFQNFNTINAIMPLNRQWSLSGSIYAQFKENLRTIQGVFTHNSISGVRRYEGTGVREYLKPRKAPS